MSKRKRFFDLDADSMIVCTADLTKRLDDLESSLNDEMQVRLNVEGEVWNLKERIIALESEAHESVQNVLFHAHDRRCWNCRWWDADTEDRYEGVGMNNRCRADLPKITEAGSIHGEFPLTQDDEWCSHWERSEELPEMDSLSNESSADDRPLILRCDDVYWEAYARADLAGRVNREREALRAALLEVADWLEKKGSFYGANKIHEELETYP